MRFKQQFLAGVLFASFFSANDAGLPGAGGKMTSPYLNKRRRSIDEVLARKNLTKMDVGLEAASHPGPRRTGMGRARGRQRTMMWVSAAVLFGFVAIGGARVVILMQDEDDRIAEDTIDALQDIMPAAGVTRSDGVVSGAN